VPNRLSIWLSGGTTSEVRAIGPAVGALEVRTRDPLVHRCLEGDAEAFRCVVDRHGRAVKGTLVRILGPRRDLDDLVQEVFLELTLALPRFREDSSLATFVTAIAANVARHAIRRGRAQARAPRPEDDRTSGENPEARASAREQLDRTFRLLSRLGADKRIAFVLVVVEDRDVREVAAMTGAEPATVRARVAAARRDLERMLESVRDP
jgi:RNA polymerase sigma-70 factor (ECF subfamily)